MANKNKTAPAKKHKQHFTRKNLIAIALVFLYCVVVVGIGLMLDASSTIFAATNPIASIVTGTFGLPAINASYAAWLTVGLFAVYVFVFTVALIYEIRLARYYDGKASTKKWWFIYILTFIICFGLWIGIIAIVCMQDPELTGMSYFLDTCLTFCAECVLMGTLVYVIVAAFVLCVVSLISNFHNIDKPYRFVNDDAIRADEQAEEEQRMQELEAQGSLDAILGTKKGGENGEGGYGEGGEYNPDRERKLGTKEYVFPGLTTIDDEALKTGEIEIQEPQTDLKTFTTGLRNYLASQDSIYFDQRIVREFVAGLASSRLIILEGLSGTGKSSLARYFSEYISEESFFSAVQASWRDRSSILGFYNDFSKSYSETDFLKRLYSMTYQPSHVNIMVLDEVNISRVEYYFADFLSVLEYPKDKWQLKIMELPYGFEPPMHLDDGVVNIPTNTWFIGTANKDDSTYTITDKVYDRAITIAFDDRTEPFQPENQEAIHISAKQINALFEKAQYTVAYKYTKADHAKFTRLTDYVYKNFGVAFGNRVLNQIENFVPVYVACGGKKEEALDFIFSSKILSKLEGRFEDYVKTGLIELKGTITSLYGTKDFALSIKAIDNLVRKL